MESSSSIVSRARTAFHSAAAKAERVFLDIKKSDAFADHSENQSPKAPNSDSSIKSGEPKSSNEVKHLTRKPAPLKTKPDWQDRLKNFRIGKKGVEDFEKTGDSTMSFAIFDENLYFMDLRDVSHSKGSETGCSPIPPISTVKQLAIAVEAGKRYQSMRDLLVSPRDSSPVKERAISAVKSLVLRDKEEKYTAGSGGDEKVLSQITSLLDSDICRGTKSRGKIGRGSDTPSKNVSSFPKEIHGAPLQSFVVKLSEVIGTFKNLRTMAVYWYKIVSELRRLWTEWQYIPGIPQDEIPDLNSCLLYQKLQVINCCISRKRRHSVASESLESIIKQASSDIKESLDSSLPQPPILYARISTGELVLRLGADKQSDSLTMLETGEPVYTPVMQEGPLLTEDLIKETEEFVLRTGSVGAGCSQLLSDMQAFKAANPGCILEDFVRWHSPPDWTEPEIDNAENNINDSDLLSSRGQLSIRMQKKGNLWHELWESAKPVPAVKQTPLFDEDLAVEGILKDLEDIPPAQLFEQLFICLLGSGFVIAEERIPQNSSISKLFFECKDYIFSVCQGKIWVEKFDDICQVYETVEMMILKPEEVQKMIKQSEDATTPSEPKHRFKRLSVIFGSRDKFSSKLTSSIFSKKPPKPDPPFPAEKAVYSVENDWTIV
ncbi:hypothetical protein NMG60_11002192 [Bertholletia excelsa]